MSIDESLLKILVCPENKSVLRLAGQDLIERLNQRISNGTLKNRSGQAIRELLDGGLVREDNKILYPIQGRIPVMLTDEAIELAE